MSITGADECYIADILGSRNPYIIPKHQRAYSWDSEEVEAFCNDILTIKEDKTYFFGGVVSITVQKKVGEIEYKIIDGQQRLATFSIALAVLRDAFNKLSIQKKNQKDQDAVSIANYYSNKIQKDYLTYEIARPSVMKKARVTLTKTNKGLFDKIVINCPMDLKNYDNNPSNKKIVKAIRIIQKEFVTPILNNTELTTLEKVNKLESILEKVAERCQIVHISDNDPDSAYQLFEALNDRAKSLAVCDYLRCTTLEKIDGNDREEEAVEYWNKISLFNNSDKYLKDYLVSYIGKAKDSNIHTQVNKEFFNYDTPLTTDQQNKLIDRVKDINQLHMRYIEILEGDWPYKGNGVTDWDKNRLLLLIKKLKHTQCIPLLLAVFQEESEIIFSQVVQIIEKSIFKIISICGVRASVITPIYAETILEIRSGNFNITTFQNKIRMLDHKYAPANAFEEGLKNLEYSENNISKIIYLLTTLEYNFEWAISEEKCKSKDHKPDKSIIYNLDSNDIEHIYSQNSKKNEVKSELEDLKNRLGNLTFWSINDNRSEKNNNFEEKKVRYSNSNIRLTREIVKFDGWSANEIKQREKLYVEMCNRVFSI